MGGRGGGLKWHECCFCVVFLHGVWTTLTTKKMFMYIEARTSESNFCKASRTILLSFWSSWQAESFDIRNLFIIIHNFDRVCIVKMNRNWSFRLLTNEIYSKFWQFWQAMHRRNLSKWGFQIADNPNYSKFDRIFIFYPLRRNNLKRQLSLQML